MNKHAQTLRAVLALHPQQVAQLFGSGKIEAAANEIDRLDTRLKCTHASRGVECSGCTCHECPFALAVQQAA